MIKKSSVESEKKQKLGVFSFFAGAGLLDLAFEDVGFQILATNEISKSFAEAYRYSRERLHYDAPQYQTS